MALARTTAPSGHFARLTLRAVAVLGVVMGTAMPRGHAQNGGPPTKPPMFLEIHSGWKDPLGYAGLALVFDRGGLFSAGVGANFPVAEAAEVLARFLAPRSSTSSILPRPSVRTSPSLRRLGPNCKQVCGGSGRGRLLAAGLVDRLAVQGLPKLFHSMDHRRGSC